MKHLLFLVVLAIAFVFCTNSMAADKCVDVEKASVKELTTLKGIGPALAKKIVDYRKKMRTTATKAKKAKWNFKNWATLLKVEGLGPKICSDNLATVCFGGKVQKSCPKKK
jgi:competence protein ComEA